jgi:hypothetical protein
MDTNMLKLQEHHTIRRFIGNPKHEFLDEIWHFSDPDMLGKKYSYIIVTQRIAIGQGQVNWKTYSCTGCRQFEDDTKDRNKRSVIEKVNEWFQYNS